MEAKPLSPEEIESYKKDWRLFRQGAKRHQWNEDLVEEVGEGIDNLLATIDSLRETLTKERAVWEKVGMRLAEFEKENAKLKAELEDKWQPIETAPKDGSWIIMTDGKFIHLFCWCERTQKWQIDRSEWFNSPTHWQPLPQQPKEG